MAFRTASTSAGVTPSSTVTFHSVTRPTGLVAGDVLVAVASIAGSGWSIGGPSGWEKLAPSLANGGTTEVFVKTATSSEPSSFEFSISFNGTTDYAIVVLRYDNANLPVGGFAGVHVASSSTAATPSVSPSVGSDVLHIYSQTDGTVTADAATTKRVSLTSNSVGIHVADEQTPGGATAPRTATSSVVEPAWQAYALAIPLLNNAPYAPTVSAPAVADIAQPTVVGVGFNDPDVGDSPSAAEIRYRRTGVGAAWSTIHRLGAHTSVTIPSDTLVSGDYEVQGRSTDALGVVGPWSSSVFFSAAAQPNGPTITNPVNGATIPAENYTGTISYPSMDSWEFRVLGDNTGAPDDTNVINAATTRPGLSRSFTMTGLPNGETVHVQVRTEVGGLWSDWVSHTNPVTYTQPAKPTITVHENSPVGAVSMFATHPAPSGSQPSVVSVDWQRQEVDAVGTPVADAIFLLRGQNLVPTAVFEDWQIVSGKRYRYRVRAWGSNDVSTFSDWAVGVSVSPANTVVYSGGHISEFDPDAPVI